MSPDVACLKVYDYGWGHLASFKLRHICQMNAAARVSLGDSRRTSFQKMQRYLKNNKINTIRKILLMVLNMLCREKFTHTFPALLRFYIYLLLKQAKDKSPALYKVNMIVLITYSFKISMKIFLIASSNWITL